MSLPALEATFVQEGRLIDYTPGSAVDDGEVVEIGNLVCVAPKAIAASALGAVDVGGVYDVRKKESVTFAAGAPVFWDNDETPYGGGSGTGAAVSNSAAGKYMGVCVKAAAGTDYSVRVLVRSAEDIPEAQSLGALSDVGTVTYTAGNVLQADGTDYDAVALTIDKCTDVGAVGYVAGKLLVADGDSFEEVALSGDGTLAADGTLTLNAAHSEQHAMVHVEDLAANADIAARPVFVHPRALTLKSIGILTEDAPAGIDDSNTCVIALKDDAGNTIVTKTYNTGTQPPSSDYEDLGTLDETHKVLAAGEHVTLTVTQGTTADMPAFTVVLVFEPTDA